MKGFYSLILLLQLSTVLEAQVLRNVYHDTDRSKLKEMYYVRDTISNILEGKYLSYYLNGNIESEGQFINNETYGAWNFYYESGKLKMKGVVKRNSSDGYWEYFYEQGAKSMEGEISNQKRRGEWKIYYESGKLKEVGVYINNKREGNWIEYYEDGNKKGEINYTYDKGKYTEYYPSGELKAEGPKSGSHHVGLWKYYFKNGNKQAEGLYANGKRADNWKFYHENGIMAANGFYKNGVPDSDWVYYFENSQISSKGEFENGQKAGFWGSFYEDGTKKGEVIFNKGTGEYTEFFQSGKVKIKGVIQNGKNEGVWKYFYEGGQLEGECNFVNGRGEYYGYYPDGTLQTKGIIEDDKKIGRWELYKNDGTLSGYYKPIYEAPTNIKSEGSNLKKIRVPKEYGVAAYKFKGSGRKSRYFKSKVNEFHGLIIDSNPFATFLGRLPIGVELYMQERLGYEVQFEAIRVPFYTDDHNVPLNDLYKRGYSISIKQKFYNFTSKDYALLYFGHELRYVNENHFSNIINEMAPDNTTRAEATEKRLEYMGLLGYRFMKYTQAKGYTVDAFVGVGVGYRQFDTNEVNKAIFEELRQSPMSLALTVGINFGYSFQLSEKR